MKKILEIICLLVFMASLFCAMSFGPTMTAGQQIFWSFSWIAVCAVSGRMFYKLHGEPHKDMEP